jgi:hypothetical protein
VFIAIGVILAEGKHDMIILELIVGAIDLSLFVPASLGLEPMFV